MDKQKRIEYLKNVIARNKGNANLTLHERLAPLNELLYLTWEKIGKILNKALDEDKKNYKRREDLLPRKN